MVAYGTSVARAMARIDMSGFCARSSRTCRRVLSSKRGRPTCFPSIRALAIPAFTRSDSRMPSWFASAASSPIKGTTQILVIFHAKGPQMAPHDSFGTTGPNGQSFSVMATMSIIGLIEVNPAHTRPRLCLKISSSANRDGLAMVSFELCSAECESGVVRISIGSIWIRLGKADVNRHSGSGRSSAEDPSTFKGFPFGPLTALAFQHGSFCLEPECPGEAWRSSRASVRLLMRQFLTRGSIP